MLLFFAHEYGYRYDYGYEWFCVRGLTLICLHLYGVLNYPQDKR